MVRRQTVPEDAGVAYIVASPGAVVVDVALDGIHQTAFASFNNAHMIRASFHSLTPHVAKLCGKDTAALYGECAALWEEAAFSTHEMNEEQREKLRHLCDALLTSLKQNTKFFQRLALRFFVVHNIK